MGQKQATATRQSFFELCFENQRPFEFYLSEDDVKYFFLLFNAVIVSYFLNGRLEG